MKKLTDKSSQLNRRKFVSTFGLLGLAGLLPKTGDAKLLPDTTGSILKTGPYLQTPLQDSITIRWITQVPCYSWVEYGEQKDKLDKKAHTSDHGLVAANNTIHAITIEGLQPARTYYYRICSKKIENFQPYKLVYGDTFTSEVYTFATLGQTDKEVSFLIFNDIHDRPESFPHLMQYAGNEKNDFVFLNGDMFNYQVDEQQLVTNLLDPLGKLFSTNTPFILSRGNHETRGKFARQLMDYFNSDRQNYYFSFQCGPMYAIVLDSGEDKPDETEVYAGIVDFDRYRIQQAEWLKKEVQKKEFKKAKYKVVFSHIPLYYSGEWHGTMHCREVWGNILNEAKIDVLISGHTHKYGIHDPVKGQHNYPIVIGGGPLDGKRTITKVKITQHAFQLSMLDDSGKEVGNLKI